MPTARDLTKLYCTICTRSRGFKNHAGLQRHETLQHASYTKLPSHIQQVPESELCHLKNTIVKELQKKLKNHYRAVGEQVFSLHCSENAFVSIFRAHITRYSPCSSFYLCSFQGEDAVKTIGVIFNNIYWCERDYGNGQRSFVRLYVPEVLESEQVPPKKKSKRKLSNGEMTIKWKVTGFKDRAGREHRAGVLQIRFFLDQCQL